MNFMEYKETQIALQSALLQFTKIFIYLLLLSLSLISYIEGGYSYIPSIIILSTYVFFRPLNFFHPNNIVFGYYFLYVSLPYVVDLIRNNGLIWADISHEAHLHYISTFLTYFFIIHGLVLAQGNKKVLPDYKYKVSKSSIVVLFFICGFLFVAFVQITGGASEWLFNYKFTYLVGRQGGGAINLLLIVFGNLLVFLLGQYAYYNPTASKRVFFIALFLFIIPSSYIHGLKSSFIFFLIIFFMPQLAKKKLTYSFCFKLFFGFFILIFIGNYFRSNGYYSNVMKFIDYIPQYFNTYKLHSIVLHDYSPSWFLTLKLPFEKILSFLGGSNYQYPSLSAWLTDHYFPEQWMMKATQQWPIETEFYLNYGSVYLGVIPIFVYSLYISSIYYFAIAKKIPAFSFLYLYEFFRFFSTFRGSMIEWQIWIYIPLYLICMVIVCCSLESVTLSTANREL